MAADRVLLPHEMGVEQTVIVHSEGDVVVHLGGLAVTVPSLSQIPSVQPGQVLLQLPPVPIPAHAPESGLDQHTKKEPIILGKSPSLHAGKPAVEVFGLLGREGQFFSAEHQRYGNGRHLHDFLVIVPDRPPIGRMVRVRAID